MSSWAKLSAGELTDVDFLDRVKFKVGKLNHRQNLASVRPRVPGEPRLRACLTAGSLKYPEHDSSSVPLRSASKGYPRDHAPNGNGKTQSEVPLSSSDEKPDAEATVSASGGEADPDVEKEKSEATESGSEGNSEATDTASEGNSEATYSASERESVDAASPSEGDSASLAGKDIIVTSDVLRDHDYVKTPSCSALGALRGDQQNRPQATALDDDWSRLIRDAFQKSANEVIVDIKETKVSPCGRAWNTFFATFDVTFRRLTSTEM